MQRVAHGLRAELQIGGGGDGDGTGLAFRVHRVNAADGQRRIALRGIKLIIVGDHQRVTAPDLVLQANRPDNVICVRFGGASYASPWIILV